MFQQMKTKIKISLFFLISICLFACTENEIKEDIFLFGRQTTKSVKIAEEKIGAIFHKEIKHSKGNFKGEKETYKNVLLFIRNKNSDYPLKTKYYYANKQNDSIRLIHYEWTKDLPGYSTKQRDKIMQEEGRKIEEYVKKYHQIAVQLGKKYGQPLANPDGSLKKERFEALEIWKKQLLWETENEKIDLSLVWIPKVGYHIHKIYCKVYYKK